MGPLGITGGRGNGIVQNDPIQALKNRIENSILQVVHWPQDGREVIGNVKFEPLGDGAFRISLRDQTKDFKRSEQLLGNAYAFDLVQVDRGLKSLVDNLDQTAIYGKIDRISGKIYPDPYAAGFGAPEDNDGNRKESD